MPVDRELPSDEARELLALAREIATRELAPRAAAAEADGRFDREIFRLLGRAGLLGLPYPERYGGGDQPFHVYLQVLEELAAAWETVALGVSVHTLACFPLASAGSDEQRERWLPGMLGGEQLGAYCLSEPQSGSDAAALQTAARRDSSGGRDEYVLTGTKAWVTHGGVADFYNVFCRTSASDGRPSQGITLLLMPAGAPGLLPQPPERKMGLWSSPTSQLVLDQARVDASRRIGAEGDGFRIAMSALDGGRLGIAAVATGVAQAALDYAVGYARQRRQFGQPIAAHQGVSFLLADMATRVAAARALYLHAAARRDAGAAYSTEASMAKLFATDAAMAVTTDAVQVLGGYGYSRDHPVERWFRAAKAMQIFEGSNQIQRMVIGRALADGG